ncbi:DUF885 domain-containing protein [Exilibacterium tricleocarpae]|uniref:DUF885 domain-containing protein n=1 Tax=Exilibacterium tricleocarpae TaxID=2591008 RepID=UPI0015D13C36|nr:DUF885 domain-containing protein [Exilibacterium tricleocarpae]
MKPLLLILATTVLTACAATPPLIADSGFAAPALAHCATDLRYLNQVGGWQATWPRQWQDVIAAGPETAAQAAATWSAVPAALAAAIDRLRLGLRTQQTAPRAVVLRVQQQVQALATDLAAADSGYLFQNTGHENARRWNRLVKSGIAPAVAGFEQFLRAEYLPAARPFAGLGKIDGGAGCFADAVTWWTTLSLPADEIEAAGRRLLRDTRAELLLTGNNGDTVDTILARLRSAAANDHTTADDLTAISEAALARARSMAPSVFTKRTQSKIVVVAMPQHLQASAPAGFYGRPRDAAPARYLINPSRPNERRLMAEVIAFHEGIPGHHLWFTYPREQSSTGYNAGILEGWAIYAEYLADEMGLYSTPFDRQGMIAKHLWAASRLVVEPGLHLRGWSREQAVEFMLANTALSRTEIEIEVDRYIAMPGQSLAYMLGADLLLCERELARKALGERFSLKAFHDIVLEPGVRSLPRLRAEIRTWVKETTQSAGNF